MVLVPLFVLSGCSGSSSVYMAGLEEEPVITENSGGDLKADSKGNSDEDSPKDGGTEETAFQEIAGYVYVCGAVASPGVYPIDQGMRVFEAIALAGGFTPDADQEWLNQAQPVQDGQRLYVYSKEEVIQMEQEGTTAGPSGEDALGNAVLIPSPDTAEEGNGKININTADQAALMTLPGIGEAKAEAVIRYRTEHGNFTSIEEIQNISGIKTAVFSKIKDLITV